MPLKSFGILQELLVTFSCLRRGKPINRFSIKTPLSSKVNILGRGKKQIKKDKSPVRAVGHGAPAGAFPVGQRKSQVFPLTGGIVAPAEEKLSDLETVCRGIVSCCTFVIPFFRVESVKQVVFCEVPEAMYIFDFLHRGENVPKNTSADFLQGFHLRVLMW